MFSSLNPFTFGRKQQAAWNALLAAYTLGLLPEGEQTMVMAVVDDLARNRLRQSPEDMLNQSGPIVFLNFIVYGLRARNIRPALGNDGWFQISNPLVDCIGAEQVIEFVKKQVEAKFGVRLRDVQLDYMAYRKDQESPPRRGDDLKVLGSRIASLLAGYVDQAGPESLFHSSTLIVRTRDNRVLVTQVSPESLPFAADIADCVAIRDLPALREIRQLMGDGIGSNAKLAAIDLLTRGILGKLAIHRYMPLGRSATMSRPGPMQSMPNGPGGETKLRTRSAPTSNGKGRCTHCGGRVVDNVCWSCGVNG